MFTGCATMITGGGHTQTVRFNSEPSGAAVLVDGNRIGITPVSAEVSRKSEHHVRMELDGFQPNQQLIKHRPNLWAFGNCCFGLVGIVGAVIDAADGADDGLLSTHDVHLRLERSNNVVPDSPTGR